MIPPFPDFPTEWSSTVEANIINQGYTYVQKETYSESKVLPQRRHLAGHPLRDAPPCHLQHGSIQLTNMVPSAH